MESVKTLAFLLLIFLGIGGVQATAQDLTPPVHNYTPVVYKAARQNWGVAIDEQGLVYSANHKGLLVFDGQRWELHPLKNGAIIRSVYPHKGRIYIGSYQEFGYWSKGKTGKYCYTSLIPLLGDYQMQSEEFWEILSYGDTLYFRSFGAIYKYDGEKIEVVRKVVSNKMAIYQDRLIVAVGQDGLFFLSDSGELEPFPHQEVLKGKTVLDLIVRDEKLLIGTRNGLYEYSASGCEPYDDDELNELLNRYELNHLLEFSEHELVIGTVKSGIIHYNEKTGKRLVYNRDKGLQNNTILGMAHKDGNLWLALDNGIDALNLNFPIRFYRDKSGELGSVYDLAFYNDSLFVASNTGVYQMTGNDFSMVAGAEGHSWNLEVIGPVLYSNHNMGTYKIIEGEFVPVNERTGSFQIHQVGNENFLIGTYHGIEIYNSASNEVKVLNDARMPVRQIIFEDPNTLWASHAYEGIYRIQLTPERDSIISVKNYNPNGEESYKANIFRINDYILVYMDGSWYTYNSFKDRLEIFDELERFKGHRFLGHEDSFYWFLNERDNSIKITDLKEEELIISPEMLNRRLVTGNERIVRKNDSIYFIALQDGFAKINLPQLIELRQREQINAPVLQGVEDKDRVYDLTKMAEIPYKSGRELTILAGLPLSAGNFLLYQLWGADSLTGRVEQGRLQFRNLAPGNYKLNLLGVSPQKSTSQIVTYEFKILPPWYLSKAMKFVYVLILMGIGLVVYKINKLKLRKHRQKLEEKYEKEHQENLYKLEKKNLLEEITMKKKELANSTLIAAKKNEVLMEIQGELSKDRNKFTDEYRLKHIMKRINKAINSRDDWKVFETNFNEVHEDFFKDILEKYPDLTNKDLKLCSYLKMNLSSKEIAPLLGISIRGVEVQRYRLRKKIGLDGKENLNNFLIAKF